MERRTLKKEGSHWDRASSTALEPCPPSLLALTLWCCGWCCFVFEILYENVEHRLHESQSGLKRVCSSCQTTQWKKNRIFSKSCRNNWRSPGWKKPEFSLNFLSCIKISYKISHRILSYIKVMRNKQSTHIRAHCSYIILFPLLDFLPPTPLLSPTPSQFHDLFYHYY